MAELPRHRWFARHGHNEIPLGVLINAEGKIVFYKVGYDISELRAAITGLRVVASVDHNLDVSILNDCRLKQGYGVCKESARITGLKHWPQASISAYPVH